MSFQITRKQLCLGIAAVLVAASTLATARAQGAPGAPPPEIAAAQAALRAGHADSAVATLEAFFAKSPNATVGRLLLGTAYRQQGNPEKALSAWLAISQPRPMRMQARFNAAGLYAQRGESARALELLQELKNSGAFDMELARAHPDFATLRNDARFESTMFRPSEFLAPFVEPVRVIHEFVGETKGDQFSWIARGIGDVDGDRVSDVATSAPTYGGTAPGAPNGAAPRGRVYVYSARSGKLLWTATGNDGETLGFGIEGAGDVNRDGVADVIAGAPGSNRAYVYSGRDGAVIHALRGSGEGFGRSVAGAGDQNSDGYADVIVGAPGNGSNGANAGRAYVYSGKDGAVLFTLDGANAGAAFGTTVAGAKHGVRTPLLITASGIGRGRVYVYDGASRAPKFTIDADSTGAALGSGFISLVGDVNHDGTLDVYAADFPNSAKGPSTGRIYVRSGVDGSRLLELTGEQAGDGFGIGSADVGDVNRDGYDDLLVGAWQYSRVAPSGGRVYLYSGRDGSVIRTITGRIPGETLGFDATGIGDVDGDGVIDLLITSSWSNIRGFQTGRMFIISGKTS